MNRVARGGLAGAVAVPAVGVAVAWFLNLAAPGDRSAAVLVYTLGALPLALIAGAVAGRRVAASALAGSGIRLLGGLVALGTAAAVALLQARIRFGHLGAEGAGSLGTLLYAEELAMVGSVAFAAIASGAAAALPTSGLAELAFRRLGLAALSGAVLALLVGPTLILTAALSRVGVDPLVVTLVFLAVVAVAGTRRSGQR